MMYAIILHVYECFACMDIYLYYMCVSECQNSSRVYSLELKIVGSMHTCVDTHTQTHTDTDIVTEFQTHICSAPFFLKLELTLDTCFA